MKPNTVYSWGSMARGLHWLAALLILAQLPLGWFANEMETGPDKITWMTLHKSLGVTLFLLMLFRLLWRVSHTVPDPPPAARAWEIRMAAVVHWTLYAAVLAQTTAGWLAADTSRIPWKLWWLIPLPDWLDPSEGLHEAAEEAHEFLAVVLVALLTLHIAAALWHHYIRRDYVLRRMWSG